MIGALYQLVENGEVCKGLEAGAAPRTAIGQKADGSLVLYTIDGRRKGYSIGASLTQVAQRMIELGCVTALSLGRRRLDDSVRHAAGGRQCRRLQHPLRGQPARRDEPHLPRCVE